MKKIKDKFKEFISHFDFKEKVIGVELLVILILIFVILFIVCFKVPKKIQNNLDIDNKSNNSEVIDSPKEEFNYDYNIDEKEEDTSKEDKKETTKKSNTETKKAPSNKDNNTKENNEVKESVNDNTDSPKVLSADEEVISYAKSVNNSLDDKSLRESAKDGFITLTDFLFYDGKIKGHTFKELSNKAKLTVLKLVLTIDSKIDKYFPEYKEKISSKYHNIKNKIVTKYLEITTNICKKDKDTCNQAKKDFQDMKKSFSLTWDFIKDLASSGKASIKEWYEIYSGK